MAAESCFPLSQFSAKQMLGISAIQIAVTAVSALFANHLLPGVSLLSSTLLSLKIFAAMYGVLSFFLLRARSKIVFSLGQLFKLLLSVVGFTLSFHAIAVMYGAPVLEKTDETFLFALIIAVLTAVPTSSLLGADLDTWQKIFYCNWNDPTLESYSLQCIALTVLGAWAGAFPIPLDWDRPWQAWPISCVVGAVLGHVIGLFTSAVTFYFNEKRLKEKMKLI